MGASQFTHPVFYMVSLGVSQLGERNDKTQSQLCERLAGPFIPLSWSCLVCKRVSHESDQRVAVNNHFLAMRPFFCMVTNGQTKTQPVDPRVSLLLTSDQAVISKNWKAVTRTFHWLPFLGIFYLNQFQAILQCKKGKNSKFDIFSELMPINPIRPGIF